MATFSAKGIEGLELSMQEIAEIPPEVQDNILMAQGEVIKKYQQQEISTKGLGNKGLLKDSIRIFKKMRKGVRYVLVYPYGKHGTRNRKKVTKGYKNSKHGRTYDVGGDVKDVTNSEVGFVLEFGAPKKGIRAYQWMREANEKATEESDAAGLAVYDAWLKTKGL